MTNVTRNFTALENFVVSSHWYYKGRRITRNCSIDYNNNNDQQGNSSLQGICRKFEQITGIDVLSFPPATFEFSGNYEFAVTLRIYNYTRYVKKFWIEVEGTYQ